MTKLLNQVSDRLLQRFVPKADALAGGRCGCNCGNYFCNSGKCTMCRYCSDCLSGGNCWDCYYWNACC
ncbi:hypothetical protein [Bailinhaonella thermotolerans]|uniref:Uncharacterized protein n=1 Tax=Bailinhaonella thermotolerans TaxID=1070861 RepID=A0A3A4BQM8_9ACTN|nr:hypothetical protein [Bailinhaonella thermotolerans]RJL33446.1 hypothetical protein D5H75_11720 [Bailinhaonella thermotolerans]